MRHIRFRRRQLPWTSPIATPRERQVRSLIANDMAVLEDLREWGNWRSQTRHITRILDELHNAPTLPDADVHRTARMDVVDEDTAMMEVG